MSNEIKTSQDSVQVAHLCTTEDMHPYECDGKGKCRHCDLSYRDGHNPPECALCLSDAVDLDFTSVFTIMGPKHRVMVSPRIAVAFSCDPKKPDEIIGSQVAHGAPRQPTGMTCKMCNGVLFIPELPPQ